MTDGTTPHKTTPGTARATPTLDPEEAARQRRARAERIGRWLLPILTVMLALLAWDRVVVWNQIPHYILPGPGLVAQTLVKDWAILGPATWVTLKIAMMALAVAVIGGVGLAVIFSLSRWAEMSFYPFAVVLQVTPVVAIAPLIFIYVENRTVGLLLCAWIVAFFPILSNTVIGLRAADANLRDLFRLYRATPWQRLRLLRLPAALPYFVAGLKISGGLSLIGAVTAEMVAGAAGRETGLASRILEASFRTETPKMFAALALLVLTGVLIFAVFNALSRWLLGPWHASESNRPD